MEVTNRGKSNGLVTFVSKGGEPNMDTWFNVHLYGESSEEIKELRPYVEQLGEIVSFLCVGRSAELDARFSENEGYKSSPILVDINVAQGEENFIGFHPSTYKCGFLHVNMKDKSLSIANENGHVQYEISCKPRE
mgnify:CR=1 FL=1